MLKSRTFFEIFFYPISTFYDIDYCLDKNFRINRNKQNGYPFLEKYYFDKNLNMLYV